jgi:cell division FtsZ-interacting protein ZapD
MEKVESDNSASETNQNNVKETELENKLENLKKDIESGKSKLEELRKATEIEQKQLKSLKNEVESEKKRLEKAK